MRKSVPRFGILFRGEAGAPAPSPEDTRQSRIFEEFARLGVPAEPVVYADEAADAIGDQLATLDGVLVWVNPIADGRDRSVLDRVLRDVAGRGVFVSAHPDVILKMGTKDVLYYTRGMAWGADTRLYRTVDELRAELPSLLRAGPRVLKQHRGNGGEGVWKAELVRDSSNASELTVQVQHAVRGATVDTMQLSEFVTRCIPYFANAGSMVDQPYQPRLPEGMIRCYLTQDRVAGFGHQFVTALLPAEAGSGPPDPSPRLYYGAEKVEFQRLRRLLEDGWVAEMQDILGISREALPVIWDADFLLGPRTAADEDTYSLCEINVSSVFPIPDEAVAPLVRTAVDGALASR